MQVQHLIEKCLLFNMDQQECARALSTYAHVQPTITVTGTINYLILIHILLIIRKSHIPEMYSCY